MDKVYPVSFAEPGMDIDFQLVLRSSGGFAEEPIPDEYRDQDSYLSPVDDAEWDRHSYPKFHNATQQQCSLKPGDCVWIPSFWWRSSHASEDTNLALSFWYGEKVLEGSKFDTKAATFSLEAQARVTFSDFKKLYADRHSEL